MHSRTNMMNFPDAVSTCLKKYATFQGTASRSEYWWFYLFCIILSVLATVLGDFVSLIVFAATIVPTIAAATRRLHDTDRSGWWQLIALLPFIGIIMLIVFLAQDTRINRYDAVPVAA